MDLHTLFSISQDFFSLNPSLHLLSELIFDEGVINNSKAHLVLAAEGTHEGTLRAVQVLTRDSVLFTQRCIEVLVR